MKNDRFKFRFWDNHDRRFYDETEFDLLSLQIDDGMGVFEQCTGKKDKNGKLVFEGDRVRTVTGAVGVVIWQEDLASFAVAIRAEYDGAYCGVDETQEIIGNIHENEERVK